MHAINSTQWPVLISWFNLNQFHGLIQTWPTLLLACWIWCWWVGDWLRWWELEGSTCDWHESILHTLYLYYYRLPYLVSNDSRKIWFPTVCWCVIACLACATIVFPTNWFFKNFDSERFQTVPCLTAGGNDASTAPGFKCSVPKKPNRKTYEAM